MHIKVLYNAETQIDGIAGLAESLKIRGNYIMFKAIHRSAPPLEANNLTNPSGLQKLDPSSMTNQLNLPGRVTNY